MTGILAAAVGASQWAVRIRLSATTLSDSNTNNSNTFRTVYCTVDNANTAITYNWVLTDTIGGNWSIVSGQGSSGVIVRVTHAPVGDWSTASLFCTVGVDNRTADSPTCALSYFNNQ